MKKPKPAAISALAEFPSGSPRPAGEPSPDPERVDAGWSEDLGTVAKGPSPVATLPIGTPTHLLREEILVAVGRGSQSGGGCDALESADAKLGPLHHATRIRLAQKGHPKEARDRWDNLIEEQGRQQKSKQISIAKKRRTHAVQQL